MDAGERRGGCSYVIYCAKIEKLVFAMIGGRLSWTFSSLDVFNDVLVLYFSLHSSTHFSISCFNVIAALFFDMIHSYLSVFDC